MNTFHQLNLKMVVLLTLTRNFHKIIIEQQKTPKYVIDEHLHNKKRRYFHVFGNAGTAEI